MREKLKAELLNCRSRILVLVAEMIVGMGRMASMLVSQNQYAQFRKSVLELQVEIKLRNHVIDDVQCFKRHELVRSFAALLNPCHTRTKATASC